MGIFDKIFGKPGAEKNNAGAGPRREIKLSDVEAVVSEKYGNEKSELEKFSAQKFSETKYLLRNIKDGLAEIEKKDLTREPGNQRLRRVVQTSKEKIVSRLDSLTDKLAPPESAGIESAQEYCLKAAPLLKAEIVNFGKDIAYTGVLLKDEIKNIGTKISELNKILEELRGKFENSKLRMMPELKGKIAGIENLEKIRQENASGAHNIENEISELKNDLSAEEKHLEERKNSPECARLKEIGGKISELREKKEKLRIELFDLIGPIEKQLRRMQQLSASKSYLLDSGEEQLLENYLGNVLSAVKYDPKAEGLKKLLTELETAISKNVIIFRDEKETQKKKEQIARLKGYDFFDNFFWKINEIDAEMIKLENELQNIAIANEIRMLEEHAKYLSARIENLRKELQNSKNSIQMMDEKIGKEKKILESMLSEKFKIMAQIGD